MKIALAALAVVRGSLLSGHDGKKGHGFAAGAQMLRPLQVT
jgi:hypothetical protein